MPRCTVRSLRRVAWSSSQSCSGARRWYRDRRRAAREARRGGRSPAGAVRRPRPGPRRPAALSQLGMDVTVLERRTLRRGLRPRPSTAARAAGSAFISTRVGVITTGKSSVVVPTLLRVSAACPGWSTSTQWKAIVLRLRKMRRASVGPDWPVPISSMTASGAAPETRRRRRAIRARSRMSAMPVSRASTSRSWAGVRARTQPPGCSPCGEERALAGQRVQLAGELARPMAGIFHAAALWFVAHGHLAAQDHDQVVTVISGREQDLADRDRTRRAVPAQPGQLTVVQRRVGGGLTSRADHWPGRFAACAPQAAVSSRLSIMRAIKAAGDRQARGGRR